MPVMNTLYMDVISELPRLISRPFAWSSFKL